MKKVVYVSGLIIFLISILLVVIKLQEGAIPFETLAKGEVLIGGSSNNTLHPTYMVFTDKDELDNFLSKLGSRAEEVINFSEDDFKKYILIFAYYGSAPSTGYEIEIRKIIKKENDIVDVIVQIKVPTYGLDQITDPYHVVKVERKYFDQGKYVFVFKDDNGRKLGKVEVNF